MTGVLRWFHPVLKAKLPHLAAWSAKRRANAVREFISARGIDTSLVRTVGYGETRLVARGASREMPGAELNRRVTFVIETGPNRASNTMALLNP